MTPAGPGRTTTARVQLVLAALVTSAAVLATTAAVDLLGPVDRAAWLTAGATALLVPAALGAGGSVRARRSAGRLLTASVGLAAVAAAVVLAQAVVVLVLGRLPDGREQALLWPVVVGLLAAALLHPVLRRLAADAVARRSAGRVRTPSDVLAAFGERGARGMPVDELLLLLAESLRHDLALRSVEVWTRSGGSLQRLVSVPHRGATVTVLGADEVAHLRLAGVAGQAWLGMWLPQLLDGREDAQVRIAVARYGGEVLGLVLADRSREAERFAPSDERRLGDVVGRLGLALHNRQLDSALQATLDDLRRTNEELRASRARLVAAADAERRRIERDIHDGAQQHLVALAVNLGLAREMLRDDPDGAGQVLAEMAVELRHTIGQLRDLAHGIYPPLLRDAGLAEALRAAGLRSPQAVEVRAGRVHRYDPEVESAVYFCCLEALQNSAKHAPGSTVRVSVEQSDGVLCFGVEDDGPGFDPATTRLGQGVQNMTDRLGAVGGSLTWTAAVGAGTRVEGRVPVPPDAPGTPAVPEATAAAD